MQKTVLIPLGIVLAACGVATTTANNSAADAAQGARRGKQTKQSESQAIRDARAMASWDEGGAPGCFNPSLAGRERAVAERLGAVPCSAPSGDAAALARGGDNWSGRYVGPFDGGQGEVSISLEPNRLYSVNMSVAGNGCSGQASGFNAPRGNVLALHVQTGNAADGAGECRITMTRQGDTLRVSESGSCTELHGMSCGFSGSATRRGSMAAATPPAPAQGASWIVGAWAESRAACRGDTGLIFDRDGTYTAAGSENGRWTLSGTTLSFTTLETFEMGEEGVTRVRNPRPFNHRILGHSANSYSSRAPDGSVMTMVRCR